MNNRSSRALTLPRAATRIATLVDGAPAVEGSDRPVGPELVSLGLEGAGRGRCLELVREGPPLAHAVIVDRPDVEPAQLEHQEHFRSPAADTAHQNQARHQLVVGESFDVV